MFLSLPPKSNSFTYGNIYWKYLEQGPAPLRQRKIGIVAQTARKCQRVRCRASGTHGLWNWPFLRRLEWRSPYYRGNHEADSSAQGDNVQLIPPSITRQLHFGGAAFLWNLGLVRRARPEGIAAPAWRPCGLGLRLLQARPEDAAGWTLFLGTFVRK